MFKQWAMEAKIAKTHGSMSDLLPEALTELISYSPLASKHHALDCRKASGWHSTTST